MARGTVVIVAGITGSQLIQQIPLIGRYPVWMNPSALTGGSLSFLYLAPNGIDPASPSGVRLSGDKPLPYFYGGLGRYLSILGWDVMSADDDWRMPAAQSGARLFELITDREFPRPLNIVCHSRGGLVTRYALSYLASIGRLDLVSRVIGLGCPHTGSLAAAQLLSGIDATTEAIRSLFRYTPGVYSTFVGGDVIHRLGRTWRSSYELLPAPTAAWLPQADRTALYQIATWNTSQVQVSAAHLAAAQAAWAAIPAPPQSVDWIDVVGVGTPTLSGLRDVDDLGNHQGYDVWGDGDGTVPVASQMAFSRRRITTPTSHRAYMYDPRILAAIASVLQSGLSADVTIPGGLIS